MTDSSLMEVFFKSIERQAFRMALFACSNQDDALDLVQDAMCRFVTKYTDKPEDEWKALFYKILQNKIRDFYRKESVRSRWRVWLGGRSEEEDAEPLEQLADPVGRTPERETGNRQMFDHLQQELKKLSLKQQQVFLLRAWEGLSVSETALAMNCSEGTIKTHYFRATEKLREKLGEHWL
ncbi:MAG: RNA polymerase sigma factor [Thermodesulfobacteriota bacterium]|nr:RNA polymerase sigma factor [Thermodesulfobacteriota bacterium]